MKREAVHSETQEVGCQKTLCRACSILGTVENGGISRLVSKGGRGVRHLDEKPVGSLSHSLRLISTCLLPHRGLVYGAIMGGAFARTSRVCPSRNITGRVRGLRTGPPRLGRRGIRHIGEDHLVCVHIKWSCQHGPGGARGLFFQITSSELVRVRGRGD